MFATLDGTIKAAVQSNKHMAFAMAKWLSKKAVEIYKRYTNKQLKRERCSTYTAEHFCIAWSKIYGKDQLIENWENTNNHLREYYSHYARRQDPVNVIMIVCKHISKDNYEHFDYPYYLAAV